MSRNELIQHLVACKDQGIKVPQEAFDLANTIDLARLERLPLREAALVILRMGLQARFRFLAIHPSLLDKQAARPGFAVANKFMGVA